MIAAAERIELHGRVTLRRTLFACGALLVVLLASVIVTALIGSERLPTSASVCALFSLGRSSCGLTADQFAILFEIRLPRVMLAAAVGASLAAAGAAYQA